jgi:hypothetical protein
VSGATSIMTEPGGAIPPPSVRVFSGAVRLGAAVLLALYSMFVARLTLHGEDQVIWAFGFADRWAGRLPGGEYWTGSESQANVVHFIPAGFLLAIVLGRSLIAAVLCVLASVCIELVQERYLTGRVSTIDDVVHNGLGGLIGALAAWPFTWLSRPVRGRRRLSGALRA